MQPGETIGPAGQMPEQTQPPVENVPTTDVRAIEPLITEAPAQTEIVKHDAISWTASEYIAHEKTSAWYLVLGLGVLGLAALVYLVTKEVVSSVVIAITGLAFGVFAARKPEELDYVLDNRALTIGRNVYPYSQFKSFSLFQDGPIQSIMLMPLKRFMPPISVYFDPADADKIAAALTSYLPHEDRKPDFVDRFMTRIRF